MNNQTIHLGLPSARRHGTYSKLLAGFISSFTIALAAVALPAQAQQAGNPDAGRVTIKLTQARVVIENGKEKLEDASVVKPGEVIEYRAVYTNTGDKPVTNLLATLPVAEGLELIPGSSLPKTPAALAATSDGKYAAMPLMRVVPGKAKPEPVPYAEYRSLRWSVPQLPANGVFVVSARVHVAEGSPKPAAPQSK
jgi:uncharacterized repeat protein (TIGR01451 family)